MSAAAAGFTHAAFYAHRRRNPGFVREWRLALQMGYERLEAALLEGFSPDAYEDDDWRHNDPPTLPALDQVTGWSEADPEKTPHDEDRALFGGWRIGDWEGREED